MRHYASLFRRARTDPHRFAGSADEPADLLIDWSRQGIDGFRLRPGVPGDDLTAIADDLVPALQHRGVFRTGYPDGSLRGLLGLTAQAEVSSGLA